MRRGPWHIFHFVGHGGFDAATEEGALALSNDAGHMHLLRATGLSELLDDHYPLRLVFLNSCEGARGSETTPSPALPPPWCAVGCRRWWLCSTR